MLTDDSPALKNLQRAFWVVSALLVALLVARPLADLDFWWHLKSGELLLRQGGLLQSDPFSFTATALVDTRERLILQGYWLWQALFAAGYAMGGFAALTGLKALLVAALLGGLAWRMRREQVPTWLALPLLGLTLGVFIVRLPLERPQVLSFLFATLLLGLFAAIRAGAAPSRWLYPLMIVWANSHGGVVVGVGLLLLFTAGRVWESRRQPAPIRPVVFWALGGIGCAFLSPCSYHYFPELFRVADSGMFAAITEYKSTLWTFAHGGTWVAVLWLLIAVHLLVLLWTRRWTLDEMLLLVFLAALSVAYMRNIWFYAFALLPDLGSALARSCERRPLQRGALALPLLAVLAVLAVGGVAGLEWRKQQQGYYGSGTVDERIYSPEVVAFIKRSGLSGRMFNDYSWGGYLLWSLYPEVKVFIDGRGMKPAVFRDYGAIESASSKVVDGVPEYKALLDRYAIDFVVMRNTGSFGAVQPLLTRLLGDLAWVPVYLDDQCYVFVRNNARNGTLLPSLAINRQTFSANLLRLYDSAVAAEPYNPDHYLTRADLLIYAARFAAARESLERLRQLAPQHPLLAGRLEFLDNRQHQRR